ncbi:E3 ubiquitin-protein ligase NLA-like [Raphanus sativus]|uniref:E3 ubiquitin-protein ligase NLA-like n=1 Tax=Raphanus sativus TaxID=3726 RepID=A0A9W3DST3_RAPSA|nr:E3 ubiquitin-protein ligase NLA-like [Raphanus sativus]
MAKKKQDTVFDPISLTCGHIYCYMCACSAASVNVVDGLKTADPSEKCPLCREVCVYKGSVHLDELSILLKRSCREYWEERRKTDRAGRLQQAKEYWDHRCRSFTGI